jgi:hypothetical protein
MNKLPHVVRQPPKREALWPELRATTLRSHVQRVRRPRNGTMFMLIRHRERNTDAR